MSNITTSEVQQEVKASKTSLWLSCKVRYAGPAEDGTIYIRLSDATINAWYAANPTIRQEALSVALTAIETGKNVIAVITDPAPYSTINRIYLRA